MRSASDRRRTPAPPASEAGRRDRPRSIFYGIVHRYRKRLPGGSRMSRGIVFANGYQSHAATETCPGHSTI